VLSRTFLKVWLLPPLLNIAIIIVGLLLLRGKRTTLRAAGYSLLLSSCLSLYLLSTPWVSEQLLRSIEHYEAISVERLPALKQQWAQQATAIVMLGSWHREFALEYADAQLDAEAMRRINYAVWLAKQLELPVLATGGVFREGGQSHGAVVAAYAKQHLQYDLRWLEEAARNTKDNAVLSTQLLTEQGIEQIVLVTQSYHMPRAVALFKAQGLTVIPAPIDLSVSLAANELSSWLPTPAAYSNSARVLHERLGWLWYRLRGFD